MVVVGGGGGGKRQKTYRFKRKRGEEEREGVYRGTGNALFPPLLFKKTPFLPPPPSARGELIFPLSPMFLLSLFSRHLKKFLVSKPKIELICGTLRTSLLDFIVCGEGGERKKKKKKKLFSLPLSTCPLTPFPSKKVVFYFYGTP